MICLSLAIIARFKITDNHARLVFTGRLKEAELGPKEVELDLKEAELGPKRSGIGSKRSRIGCKRSRIGGGAENRSIEKWDYKKTVQSNLC